MKSIELIFILVILTVYIAYDFYSFRKLKNLKEEIIEERKHIEKAAAQVDEERMIIRKMLDLFLREIEIQEAQIRSIQHLVNGQRLKFAAINSYIKEIDKSLEEVIGIESNFISKSKKAGRKNRK